MRFVLLLVFASAMSSACPAAVRQHLDENGRCRGANGDYLRPDLCRGMVKVVVSKAPLAAASGVAIPTPAKSRPSLGTRP